MMEASDTPANLTQWQLSLLKVRVCRQDHDISANQLSLPALPDDSCPACEACHQQLPAVAVPKLLQFVMLLPAVAAQGKPKMEQG